MSYQTNTSQTWDSTTGPDLAYKAAQERSQLKAKNLAMMYGGDIPNLMSSIGRIRDLQQYLKDYGLDPDSMAAIPETRLEKTQVSSSQSGHDAGDYDMAQYNTYLHQLSRQNEIDMLRNRQ
jgi:hypothetical protein